VSGSGRPLLVPETGQLFIGAGTRLLGYESRSGSPRATWAPRSGCAGAGIGCMVLAAAAGFVTTTMQDASAVPAGAAGTPEREGRAG